MISLLKFLFRLTGLVLLAVAIIAGISDASTSIAQSQVQLQPLGQLLFSLFPDTFPILQPAIERHIHPSRDLGPGSAHAHDMASLGRICPSGSCVSLARRKTPALPDAVCVKAP